jgi:hypothetical protein
MNRTYLSLLLASLCTATGFAGTRIGIGLSFGAPAPIVVHRAPPARVVEQVTVAPGPGYAWVPGHYTWAGDRWIWMSGTWVVPPRPDARWVDGAWNPQNQQWVEAHWEVVAPQATVAAPMGPPPPPPGQTEVVVNEAPPAPVQEVITVAPSSGYIWVNGYWGWEHGHREWIRGHWELPPRGYHTWVEPRWEHHGRGYVFVRGYWR